MRRAPMLAPADFDVERNVELGGGLGSAGHDFANDCCSLVLAPVRHFEYQFVMDLKQHSNAVEAGLHQRIVHPSHPPLAKLAARALNRAIDRASLRPRATST